MKQQIEKIKNIDFDQLKYQAWWKWRAIKFILNPPKDFREEYSKVVYKPIEINDVWKVCPVAFTNPEQNIVLTRDLIQARFFELKGVNYDSISSEQLCQKHEAMKNFLEQLPHDQRLSIFSRRFLKKTPKASVTETSCSKINQEIIDSWSQSFNETHENQFVLMVQTARPPTNPKADDAFESFERTTGSLEAQLAFLGAPGLSGDDLSSFLHSLLKMDPLARWQMPEDGALEEYFPGSQIKFLPDTAFKARINQTEYRSSCIVAKSPMERLFSLNREFCMVQQVGRLTKAEVFKR